MIEFENPKIQLTEQSSRKVLEVINEELYNYFIKIPKELNVEKNLKINIKYEHKDVLDEIKNIIKRNKIIDNIEEINFKSRPYKNGIGNNWSNEILVKTNENIIHVGNIHLTNNMFKSFIVFFTTPEEIGNAIKIKDFTLSNGSYTFKNVNFNNKYYEDLINIIDDKVAYALLKVENDTFLKALYEDKNIKDLLKKVNNELGLDNSQKELFKEKMFNSFSKDFNINRSEFNKMLEKKNVIKIDMNKHRSR